eukprot:1980894-Prymnesium_polylepis.2
MARAHRVALARGEAAAARSGGGCDTRACRPRPALTRGEDAVPILGPILLGQIYSRIFANIGPNIRKYWPSTHANVREYSRIFANIRKSSRIFANVQAMSTVRR